MTTKSARLTLYSASQGEKGMRDKKVIIMITSSPFATLNNYEAIRTSIGLIFHRVYVIWRGEGVYNALKTADDSSIRPFIRLFKDLDIALYVDRDDLKVRGLQDEELLPEVKNIERAEVLDIICEADVVLTF